ncbi:pyridoxamine 5'-phosphate oxidase family protein [Streptomyces sp. 8L]|nr:MSMEG_1061 family FMN-dependent PPOX-type flavoprotein [Streptomyces sp. 8L]MCA1219722.1 pyridoxamine 5'-phosphate oxidase family protein [Streptomyces sp. 8L]
MPSPPNPATMTAATTAAAVAVPSRPAAGAPAPAWTELRSPEELTELLGGAPHPIVIEKVRPDLTDGDVELLGRSPFCVVATSDDEGNCDTSPRGGDPGFVHVLDRGTVVLPDRPGNRRGDTFRNVLRNPHVGLLHLVPGDKEILRINGRARILTDAPFFDLMSVRGQRPSLALLVEIDESFRHCPQSLRRSGIWDPRP